MSGPNYWVFRNFFTILAVCSLAGLVSAVLAAAKGASTEVTFVAGGLGALLMFMLIQAMKGRRE